MWFCVLYKHVSTDIWVVIYIVKNIENVTEKLKVTQTFLKKNTKLDMCIH